MKEPVRLYTLDRLEYSQEILLHREPKELSLTIWIIVSLFVAVICWIVFGKMEETVRAKGIVRPVSNISQVKNAVSGEITGLYYRPAERVEKDALLLKINSLQNFTQIADWYLSEHYFFLYPYFLLFRHPSYTA